MDVTPIFVIGLPRSGTTLIEQILASHPRVEAGGELTAAMQCEQEFRQQRHAAGRTGRVEASDATDRALLETARERYLEALFERNLDAPFIVDKLPANFRIAGFLRLLFAAAPIMHSRRQGAATCFSLYNANFAGHEPYYHDLEHLAHYYGQYRRLMQHWHEVVEPPLHTVHYEALVTDPARQIPALLHAPVLDQHPTPSGIASSGRSSPPAMLRFAGPCTPRPWTTGATTPPGWARWRNWTAVDLRQRHRVQQLPAA
ncbi:MAG: sulfotransferase [Gammaproteobacteria bacterium]|nr:sulfotransferase [Gammaproteobacteria bacterium]